MGKAGQGYKLLRSCALRLLALAAAAAIPSGASSAEAVDGILISSRHLRYPESTGGNTLPISFRAPSGAMPTACTGLG